jgi:hypothetical protein
MLSGGSTAARGTTMSPGKETTRNRLQPGETVQTVYETRFLAYLSRFLLTYDPAANAWWVKNGLGNSWDMLEMSSSSSSSESSSSGSSSTSSSTSGSSNGGGRTGNGGIEAEALFAEFAESVEIGLADYFVGPYGSYSSLSAMKAGISAAAPAKSARSPIRRDWFLGSLFFPLGGRGGNKPEKALSQSAIQQANDKIAKQGILNLYTLLKARYTTNSAKRQLAILFSFICQPQLQPVAEIRSLLGEADNATITKIDVIKPFSGSLEPTSRTSSRRGGGYSATQIPEITIEAPPALGTDFQTADAVAIMKPTSRILRIRVVDGGAGYTSAPDVSVQSWGRGGIVGQRPAMAIAILDREGHVDSVLVLDPGWGYSGGGGGSSSSSSSLSELPKVVIAPPKPASRTANLLSGGTSSSEGGTTMAGSRKTSTTPVSSSTTGTTMRRAKAVAELEYEIVGIDVIRGGNGFVATEPPKVSIRPPEDDPDWFIDVPELTVLQAEFGPVRAEVAQMKLPNGNLAYSIGARRTPIRLNLDRIRQDPLELLPSTVRPKFYEALGYYTIPFLPPVPPIPVGRLSPRYREIDPIFGAIGTVPVTKSANELEPSEYARLALSGAMCTVLVRTALNPLELIKTKLQLKNDKELFEFAQEQKRKETKRLGERSAPVVVTSEAIDVADPTPTTTDLVAVPTPTKKDHIAVDTKTASIEIGTLDLITSLIQLRGPLALFQSADITFLASLVFGSFGFGATELFRRSFTGAFLTESGGDFEAEIILLVAAAVATVITSAAAAPFELLRVRSMGLVEARNWTEVLDYFLLEKAPTIKTPRRYSMLGYNETHIETETARREQELAVQGSKLGWKNPKSLLPLWAGFQPTVSRELAFAIPKFLAFDVIAKTIVAYVNSQAGPGALPIQVGIGTTGLIISAFSGAIAGLAGALVSHPADLILTYTSAASKKKASVNGEEDDADAGADWRDVVRELTSREGGVANLFLGLSPRLAFFFLVIGLQFFLYDYVKNILQVGSDDLSLVLDVFYAIRQGLPD